MSNTNINELLPTAPEGHFWRIFVNEDEYLMLELREGNEKKSTQIYKAPIASSQTNEDIVNDLIADTGRFVLKYAFPQKRDWTSYEGTYGLA